MTSIASPTAVSGRAQIKSRVAQSPTSVVAGSAPSAIARTMMSRSVMSPRSRPPDTTGRIPTLASFVVTAASTSDAEVDDHDIPDHHVPDVIAAAGPPSTRASPERDGTGGDDTDCEPEPGVLSWATLLFQDDGEMQQRRCHRIALRHSPRRRLTRRHPDCAP